MLAYDYRDLEESREQALPFLTKSFAADYTSNFDNTLVPNAGRTETVVDCEVLAAGVGRVVDEDRVEVVLFMDRPTSNVDRSTVFRDQATFAMVLVGGTWLLDDIAVR